LEREKIPQLLLDLRSELGRDRRRARRALERIGEPVVPELLSLLEHRDPHLRWEAAKALGAIASPSSARALVKTLKDEDGGVRWLAAEALVALGRDGLVPLLESLFADASSSRMRRGAHHVLKGILDPQLAEVVAPVRESLEAYALLPDLTLNVHASLMRLRDLRKVVQEAPSESAGG
jgi:HEAT repeat protein